MKNHQFRPTRFEPFPEVNVISSQTHGRGRGHGSGRGQNSRYYNNHPSNPFKRKDPFPCQKRNNGETKQENGETLHKKNPSRLLKRLAIDAEWKDIGLVPIVQPNIW